MPLIPQGPPPGLAAPMGAPAGLAAPPVADVPPAAAGALALAPLAQEQQSILDAVKAKLAEQAMAAAMQAIAGVPNPAAEAAQTEPGAPVELGPGQADPMQTGGY